MLAAGFTWAAVAQPEKPPETTSEKPKEPAAESEDLTTEARRLIRAREFDRAEAILRKQIDLGQAGFVPYYNLACVRSARGAKQEAVEWLLKAIERGFADVRQLRRDPMLSPLREEPGFRAIVDQWPKFLEKRADADAAAIKEDFGGTLAERREPALRLIFLAAKAGGGEDPSAVVRGEVERVAAWAEGTGETPGIFKGLMTDAASAEDAWVSIVTPDRPNFLAWVRREYGPAATSGFAMVGGQYSHGEKRLVSMDSGSSLRHEFFHVLHWRDMERRGQEHPIYVQEGLAALVEDYDVVGGGGGGADGGVVIAPSWRTNSVKRRERTGGLMRIEQLAAMDHTRFTRQQPLANYALARTVFLWLEREGKLAAWYTHYTANFRADPTGIKSFEAVLGAPIKDLNMRFRDWVFALPEVPEEVPAGGASLGASVEVNSGDGVTVVGLARDAGAGLRIGDVVRSIGGKPTREMAELVRVLGTFTPGDEVDVEIRRGESIEIVRVTLRRKPG
jgi:hypothetical protein